tara:strand:- start:2672 stop:3196 length:525 start_codon:yes stop_codon:yes gene_type:complete
MPKNKDTRQKLSKSDREEIVRLAEEEEMTYTAIAKKMGCSVPNISYLMKRHRNKKAEPSRRLEARKKAPANPMDYSTDPIKFRIGKLYEIESDIEFARSQKVIHTLGGLHKLHISIHDELRTFIEASQDQHGATPNQLKIEIVDAIQSLPPLLKKQIMDELLVEGNNIVRLKTQ